MPVHTVGHGARSIEELVDVLGAAGVETLVDVRRFAGSRRHPQFNKGRLAASLETAGIAYVHAVELGGRLADEPGEDAFGCIAVPAFRSYAARMRTAEWQAALAGAVARPAPAFMCAETSWRDCHRSLIAEQLHARGREVVHLVRSGESEPHQPALAAETRNGALYLCGMLVG